MDKIKENIIADCMMADIFGELKSVYNKRKYARAVKGMDEKFNIHALSLVGTVHFAMKDTNPESIGKIIDEWAELLNVVFHTKGVMYEFERVCPFNDRVLEEKLGVMIKAHDEWWDDYLWNKQETLDYIDKRIKHWVSVHTLAEYEHDDEKEWISRECISLYRVLLNAR